MIANTDYFVLWEFQVRAEARLSFEAIYGPEGDWNQLFRRSPEYRGTQLFRDIERPGRYLTVDHWTFRDAFRHFKSAHQDDYDVLDQRCESLTDSELLLGEFEAIGSRL